MRLLDTLHSPAEKISPQETEKDPTLLSSLKSHKGKRKLKPGSRLKKNNLVKKRRMVRGNVKNWDSKCSKDPPVLLPIGSEETDRTRKRKNRKKNKKKKIVNSDIDEASRLQRRTRYLLIKMKLEQNLIDAYSAEGWKGQSREKIRPEKELQRAVKQILKCKLGVRDVIRQLDSLSSAGSIEESVMAPDGSVFHEHIFCAKCKSNEASPDNDIILCDGTCNSAFHQKCLDPPLDTESIPPGNQEWFCRFCDCRMEILEALNAHLGTDFSMNNSWEDVFEEEASLPGGNGSINQDNEWPSDDSEDVDYDPERRENSCGTNVSGDECSFESDNACVGSDESSDAEILCGRRQRRDVDYIKLYDEMFGKDAKLNEQLSEDEDWGPTKRRKKVKESDDAVTTPMTLHKIQKNSSDAENGDVQTEYPHNRKSFFRIPRRAVERLRQVFAENELPSRDVKENISKELGLDSEKVSKWFKNARYMALKTRKEQNENLDSGCQNVVTDDCDFKMIENARPETVANFAKNVRKRSKSLSACSKNKHVKESTKFRDDEALTKLVNGRNKEEKRIKFAGESCCNEAEAEMERLCKLKFRIETIKQKLVSFRNGNSDLHGKSVMYVPCAELREKA